MKKATGEVIMTYHPEFLKHWRIRCEAGAPTLFIRYDKRNIQFFRAICLLTLSRACDILRKE